MWKTPYISGCAKYGDVTIFFLTSNRVQCHQTYAPRQKKKKKKKILLAELVLDVDGKIFRKGDGFPDSVETPSRRDFRAMMYYDYRQATLSAQLPNSVKLLLGPVSIVIYCSQLV